MREMEKSKIYVTSAFSLSMLPEGGAYLKVTPASLDEMREVIKAGALVRIGHQSTAQVLSELVGSDIRADRTPVHIEKGDIVFVFQILQRPQEGQVFSEQEIREIVEQGKYKVLKVIMEG